MLMRRGWFDVVGKIRAINYHYFEVCGLAVVVMVVVVVTVAVVVTR